MATEQITIDGFKLDIIVYRAMRPSVQAHFLVHGIDGPLWTNSVDAVIEFLKQDLTQLQQSGYSIARLGINV